MKSREKLKIVRFFRYTLLVLFVTVFFVCCSTTGIIEVKDNSVYSVNKSTFLDSLISHGSFKVSQINSYSSKNSSVEFDGIDIPLYSHLKLSVSLNDSSFNGRLFTPFPVIDVARFCFVSDSLVINNKVNNAYQRIFLSNSFLSQELIRSVFYGTLSPSLIKESKSVSLSVLDDKVSFFQIFDDFNFLAIINRNLSLSSLSVYNDDIQFSFICSDYSCINGIDIPTTIIIASSKYNGQIRVSLKKIEITTN